MDEYAQEGTENALINKVHVLQTQTSRLWRIPKLNLPWLLIPYIYLELAGGCVQFRAIPFIQYWLGSQVQNQTKNQKGIRDGKFKVNPNTIRDINEEDWCFEPPTRAHWRKMWRGLNKKSSTIRVSIVRSHNAFVWWHWSLWGSGRSGESD